MALFEWHQEKQGVQQELLREPRQVTGDTPSLLDAVTVSMPASKSSSGEQIEFMPYEETAKSFIGTCPDCGSQLEFAEGCVKCHVCGFSECG
ncbi:MAG: response regulator SirA, partial [Gemmatimonadaceae bacterium]